MMHISCCLRRCHRPLTAASHRLSCRGIIHSTVQQDASSDSTNGNHRPRKRLDVAIVGAPNAGKSQLLNSLIGSKVAAVSRKRHTTRTGILGARTFDDTQLVFIDTPGFLHHKMSVKEGVRKLLGEATSEMECADFTLLVIDAARKIDEDMKRTLITLIFLALRSKGRDADNSIRAGGDITNDALLNKFAVVVNKVDLVNPKEKLLLVVSDVGSLAESCIRRLLQQRRTPSKIRLVDLVDSVLENYTEEEGFDNIDEEDMEVFAAVAPEFLFTSAINKDDEGINDVLGLLLERATPSKEWIVDPDSKSGMAPIEQVEEIIREKIYRCLHREVPHCVQQQNRMFRLIEPTKKSKYGSSNVDGGHNNDNILRIHQDLVVTTKSHQKLVLGSGGKTLERIRLTALTDLEEAFECEVDLNLNVRISKLNQEVSLEAESEGASSFTL